MLNVQTKGITKSFFTMLGFLLAITMIALLTGCGGSNNSALHSRWLLDEDAENTRWDWVELELESDGTGRSVEKVFGSEVGLAVTWEAKDGRLSLSGVVFGIAVSEVYDYEISSGQLRLEKGEDVWYFNKP